MTADSIACRRETAYIQAAILRLGRKSVCGMEIKVRRAYITGATGAIGMALTAKLLKENINVTVFLRRGSARNERFDMFAEEQRTGRLKLVYVDLEELAEYCTKEHQERCREDVFYHLGWSGTFGAARNDRKLQQDNIEYTLDAVGLAERLGCGRFVGAGSQAEYGRPDGVLTPDIPAAPENEYGKAKLEAGIESRKLCQEFGIMHCWVRILSVYGPYDGDDTMIMSTIRKLLLGQDVPLTEGVQLWDYLYSEDAADAMYRIGELPWTDKSKLYCLAGGEAKQLKEYILMLCSQAGADESLLKFGAVAYTNTQVMRLTADIHALTEDTGFRAQTTFEDGIKKTIDWRKNIG